MLLRHPLELLPRIGLALEQGEAGHLVVGARGQLQIAQLLERRFGVVETILRLERVSERLLRERAQRMSLRRAGEELLQVFLGPGRVRTLQLVKADLGEGGLRRGRAAVVSAHLLERGDHRLLPLLLARERFLAWLGRSFRGDRPRLQLDRLRQLCAGFRLAGSLPGAEAPAGERDRDQRPPDPQDQAAVRDHPVHGASRNDLELVRSLQLLAIDSLGHRQPSCRTRLSRGTPRRSQSPCKLARCASSPRFCSHSRPPRRRSSQGLLICSCASKGSSASLRRNSAPAAAPPWVPAGG